MKNKKEFILKTVILLIGIGFILLLWFGFRTIDNQAIEIASLEEENAKHKEQIEYLQNYSSNQTEIIEESEASNIKESINVFINSVYHVEEGNYEERRSNAETTLIQKKFNELFPEIDEYEVIYEYDIKEITSYIDQTKEDEASAYVTFEQTETNVNNDTEQDSKITLQIFLQKEGDKWLVNEFKQINAEPL